MYIYSYIFIYYIKTTVNAITNDIKIKDVRTFK